MIAIRLRAFLPRRAQKIIVRYRSRQIVLEAAAETALIKADCDAAQAHLAAMEAHPDCPESLKQQFRDNVAEVMGDLRESIACANDMMDRHERAFLPGLGKITCPI